MPSYTHHVADTQFGTALPIAMLCSATPSHTHHIADTQSVPSLVQMYHVPGKHFDNAHYRSFSWMGVAKAMSLKKQCQHLLYYSVNRDIVRILRNPRENTHAPIREAMPRPMSIPSQCHCGRFATRQRSPGGYECSVRTTMSAERAGGRFPRPPANSSEIDSARKISDSYILSPTLENGH